MATYQLTLTNGFVHTIKARQTAMEEAASLRHFLAQITVDGRNS